MKKIKTAQSAAKLIPLNRPVCFADTPPKRGMAFTLAEILITLSIIGVVAALTIPTLIQRTGDEETISKLNKAYSTLVQATELIITEKGGVQTWAKDDASTYEAYKEHLRILKDCGNDKKKICYGVSSYKGFNTPAFFGDFDATGVYRVITSDGMPMHFSGNAACNGESWGTQGVCGDIWVDINGKKAPNALGRDMFSFILTKNGLQPTGCDADFTTVCSSSVSGTGCTCKPIVEQKIDY